MQQSEQGYKTLKAFLIAPLIPVLILLISFILNKLHQYGFPGWSLLFIYNFLRSFVILFFFGATISYMIALLLFFPQHLMLSHPNSGYIFYSLIGITSGIIAYFIIVTQILPHLARDLYSLNPLVLILLPSSLLASLVFRYILGKPTTRKDTKITQTLNSD